MNLVNPKIKKIVVQTIFLLVVLVGLILMGKARAAETGATQISAVPSAFLKDIGSTTAETLLFTPPSAYVQKEWSLLKGVAAISVDGKADGDPTKVWQKSAAEVLYVGVLPMANITKDGSHYVVAGGVAEYNIYFSASNILGGVYTATVSDTITVSKAGEVSQDNLVTIENPLSQVISSTDCPSAPILNGWTVDLTTPGKIIFGNLQAIKDCTYKIIVKLNIDANIAPNTVIQDTAMITTTEGAKASADFTTLAVGSFTQETEGGGIYARGALSFGQLPTGQYGGKYVIGADGNIQTTASEQGWTLDSYGIRSGSTDNFDPENCISGSACKAMNDNIARLKKGAINLDQPTINGTFYLNPNNIPEGGVYIKRGSDLRIGGASIFQGKGTIIIEDGDLLIDGNIDTDSILGIIVKNGNVIVSGDPSVTSIKAIFYIFSDTDLESKGQFIVNSNMSGPDTQLVITGAVIASGYYDSSAIPPVRKEAFVLARRYAGDPIALEAAALDFALNGTPIPDNLFQPAELFLYDSRIIVSPPPGFGGKIIGSM